MIACMTMIEGPLQPPVAEVDAAAAGSIAQQLICTSRPNPTP